MGSVLGWVLMVLGAIMLIAILAALLALFGYRRLTITFKPISAMPEFKFKLASLLGSMASFIARNFVSAAGGFVSGVKLSGRVVIHNHSFMPLYLPAIEHVVSIGGKPSLNPICTRSLWLRPGASVTLPVTLTIGTADIPELALDGLTHGGAIAVEIASKVKLGSFSVLKSTRFTIKRPKSLNTKPARAAKKLPSKTSPPGFKRVKSGTGDSSGRRSYN